MHRPQFGSQSTGGATLLMNGNEHSPEPSSAGSASGGQFPDELEARHMEITSQMAKFQDVSARQAWPAVFAGKTALDTCSTLVVQHADAFVQEMRLLERRMQETSQTAELGRQNKALQEELVEKEQQLQEVLDAQAVRDSRG